MADIVTPKLDGKIRIPLMEEGATAHYHTLESPPEINEALGYPGELVDNWQEKAVEVFREVLDTNKALRVFMDICVKCGSCTDKCHYFIGTHDSRNMPVARQDLMRKVYRRYFTLGGKLFPKLVGAEDFTKEVLDEWYTYFHQCSQCRRCSVFCPYGIDTAEISMAARLIMNRIGLGSKYSNEIIGKVYNTGNNLGIPAPALEGTMEFLEEDVREATGVDVRYPMDEKGTEVLLIPPSADFFSAPHVDSLIGYGKVFHEAGISWTVSSYASEFANFGMFVGDFHAMRKIAQRIKDVAREFGVKRIIVGECGHAWRVGHSFWNTLVGPWDFLDSRYPVPQHICEFTLDLIKRGGLKLDKSANDERIVTFHDSCNVARASSMGGYEGGQFEIPRELIKYTCNNFVEMAEETIKEKTYCCGGGGGLLTDDLMELRIQGVLPRAEALHAVMESHGVNYLALICAICKAQFTKVLPYYDIPMEIVGGVHQLVGDAIVLGGAKHEV